MTHSGPSRHLHFKKFNTTVNRWTAWILFCSRGIQPSWLALLSASEYSPESRVHHRLEECSHLHLDESDHPACLFPRLLVYCAASTVSDHDRQQSLMTGYDVTQNSGAIQSVTLSDNSLLCHSVNKYCLYITVCDTGGYRMCVNVCVHVSAWACSYTICPVTLQGSERTQLSGCVSGILTLWSKGWSKIQTLNHESH